MGPRSLRLTVSSALHSIGQIASYPPAHRQHLLGHGPGPCGLTGGGGVEGCHGNTGPLPSPGIKEGLDSLGLMGVLQPQERLLVTSQVLEVKLSLSLGHQVSGLTQERNYTRP